MGNEKKGEEIVRIYRGECNNDVLVEILGEPIVALKQMKAEPWLLKDAAKNSESPETENKKD